MRTKNINLIANDRVLVRNVSLRGKQKLADKWEEHPYVIISQPDPTVPVYQVKREGDRYKKVRTLHRNLLLPFMSVTDVEDTEADLQTDGHTTASGNEDTPYIIPMRRTPGSPGLSPPKERPKRQVNKPDRYIPAVFRK